VDVSELDEVAGEGAEMNVTLASSAEDHLESNARIPEYTWICVWTNDVTGRHAI